MSIYIEKRVGGYDDKKLETICWYGINFKWILKKKEVNKMSHVELFTWWSWVGFTMDMHDGNVTNGCLQDIQ